MTAAATLLALLGRPGAAPSIPATVDWRAVVEIARWHGLEPLLAHRLGARGMLALLPEDLRAHLAGIAVLSTLRDVARRRQLGEALGALAAAGIPVVPLKGAALAEHAYPASSLRRMSDFDLLLPEGALEHGRDVLLPFGYVPDDRPSPSERHAPALRRPGGLPIELHDTINPCHAPFRLPLADVLARTVPAQVAGHDVRVLEPIDLLVHLATHMGHGHVLGASLSGVVDILMWTERHGDAVDWKAVVARARTAGAERFVHAALLLARKALGARVPAAPLAALRTRGDEAVANHALRLLTAPPFLVLGAKAVTDPRDGALARTWRIARALLVRPARDRAHPAEHTVPLTSRVRGYGARWSNLGHLLLHPAAGREALRHVIGVRAVRRWAGD